MIELEVFVNEKLKVKPTKVNDDNVVILKEFLLWLFDEHTEDYLSLDYINDSCDALYRIEEFYKVGLKDAYKFLSSYFNEPVNVIMKKLQDYYEYTITFPYNDTLKIATRKDDISIPFYDTHIIPDKIIM